MFSWFLADKPQQKSIKFNPKVQINTKSSLFVQVQPKDPTTTSNIIITAFTSFQNRTIVPIKVQWSRFKLRSQAIHSVQKINGLIGNTYMCEPNDVGGYIKAIVRTTDEYMRQQAQVTIGPIAIDVMIKRVIDGALYSGSLLSQVVIWQKDKKNNVNVRLYNRRIQFIDEISQEKLVKDYTLSEPKIQLNPKDPTRIYLRFEQDQINEVRDWLNKIFHLQSDIMDESSLSIRVPYSSTGSSKVRLFQKTHNPCSNKFQMRFISRLSRDLFLFTQRAFICKEDMKNSIYIQKLQTLQNLTTEQDYHKFLEYISLKLQILRLADYAKEVQEDRNSKVKDLVAMQESIGQMTLTYLKIIEQKGKHQKIDLEVSYSQINHTRQQIMNRKNVRQLKNENQKLKNRLREMNEEIQLLKFFKKQDNQSMIFNQTSNPFAKKQNQSINVSPQDNRKNMYQISINYANLLQENKQLKKQMKMQNQPIFSKQNRGKLDHSQNMIDILGSLQQKEEQQAKFNQYQNTIRHLKKQIEVYRKNAEQMQHQINNKQIESNKMIKILNKSHLEPSFVHNHSVINQSINSAASDSFMNHTVTSEMAIAKLQENLNSLHDMNNRLQDDNTRLRRQRDYFKSQYSKIQSYLKQMSQHNQNINNQQQYLVHQKHQVNLHNNSNMLDQSTIHRYRQQNQALQNERNSLLRKVQSLAKQNNNGLKEQFLKRQKIIKQLQEKIQQLLNENKNLSNKQTNFNQEQLQLLRKQNSKIKKVNLDLLQDIKSLKIELQNRIGDNMYNSRVIQLENQLGFVKKSSYSGFDSDKKLFIDQINDLTKTNIKLKKQNQDKQLKLNTQALTIEKLMLEHSSFKQNNTPNKDPSSLSSTNSKEKSYSQKCNQSSVEEVQKYKRQVKKLQQQIIFIKKSSDAINRSRDLTMEMDGYYEEKIEIMKRQMDTLYVEIQNVGKMCQRYRKEALEANKELMKWRQKAMNLMKIKDEDSLLIN